MDDRMDIADPKRTVRHRPFFTAEQTQGRVPSVAFPPGPVQFPAAMDELPFPDKDISPGLQHTLKRKFESGEEESVDRDAFFGMLGQAVTPPDEEVDPSS